MYDIAGRLSSGWCSIIIVDQEGIIDLRDLSSASDVLKLEINGDTLTLKSSCMHSPTMNWEQSGIAICCKRVSLVI